MLLRAPAHCTGLSHEGRDYLVGADGRIEVEDHLAPFFLAHGFVREAVPAPSPLVGGEVPDIDALNRKALFALLREKGVRVRLPITNDALREAARRALLRGIERSSSPFDLVSLADLKTWLDLASTDDDALLGRLITQVSRATLAFLDRGNILPARVVETRDGRNDTEIVLRQWPATSIAALSIDGAAIAPAPPLVAGSPHRSGYLLEAAERAPPGHMQRLALRGRLFTAGVQNICVAYTAGYQVSAEPAVVPATAPYEVLAQEPYGDWAGDCGVVYAERHALGRCRIGTRCGGICNRGRRLHILGGGCRRGSAAHLRLCAGRSLLRRDGLDCRAL